MSEGHRGNEQIESVPLTNRFDSISQSIDQSLHGLLAPEFLLFDGFTSRHCLADRTAFTIGSGRIHDPAPLGAPPVEFTDARGVKMIGPDPQKLNPRQVEIPTLWVLSRVAPDMVPAIEEV